MNRPISTTSVASVIETYIADNPGCERPKIVEDTGFGLSAVSTALTRLRRSGRIRKRIADKVKGKRAVQWEIGCEPNVKKQADWIGQPRQSTVSEWKTEARRDPLHIAFFGQPKQQLGDIHD